MFCLSAEKEPPSFVEFFNGIGQNRTFTDTRAQLSLGRHELEACQNRSEGHWIVKRLAHHFGVELFADAVVRASSRR